jgi:hypothetical protein
LWDVEVDETDDDGDVGRNSSIGGNANILVDGL